MYNDILLPTDGSDAAEAAVEQALELAGTYEATLHVIFAVELSATIPLRMTLDSVIDQLEADGEEFVTRIADQAAVAGVDVETGVVHGVADEAIVDYVEANDIDLVVMGTHGHRGIDRHLLGSSTERVIRISPVPVLVVRQS